MKAHDPATTAAALLKSQADSLEAIRRLALALVVVASIGTATMVGTVARVWWLASQAQAAASDFAKAFSRPVVSPAEIAREARKDPFHASQAQPHR